MTDMPTGPTDANPTTRYDPPPRRSRRPRLRPSGRRAARHRPSSTPPSAARRLAAAGGDAGRHRLDRLRPHPPGVGLWYFADRTLGLELPRSRWTSSGRSPSSCSAAGIVLPLAASRRVDRLDPGRRLGGGSRLSSPTGAAGSPRCTPRSGRSRPPIRRSRIAHWRAVRERLFREHPQSPVPPRSAPRSGRATSTTTRRCGSTCWSSRAAAADPAPSRSSSRTAARTRCRSAGSARAAPVPGRRAEALGLLDGRLCGRPVHPVPRRHERARDVRRGSLSGGRARRAPTWAATRRPATLILDFNFAFQPSCAFDPRWACPLAPPENRLDIDSAPASA